MEYIDCGEARKKLVKKLNNLSLAVVPVPLTLLLLTQCRTWGKIDLSNDSNSFTKEVQRHIHDGSSTVDAKKLLELNEFECTDRKSSKSSKILDQKKNGGDDGYLFCSQSLSWHDWSRIYTITVYYRREEVTRVNASVDHRN